VYEPVAKSDGVPNLNWVGCPGTNTAVNGLLESAPAGVATAFEELIGLTLLAELTLLLLNSTPEPRAGALLGAPKFEPCGITGAWYC
jgi:hypothetical protein